MPSAEYFTSRWGLLLAVTGIAVGTGNIWRFPRIAANNGGGSFLIPWVIFLFLWSIPLIMAEFAIGKKTRCGTIGSFSRMMGQRYAWMGGFVGIVAIAIMFYYSVLAGWCLRYFLTAATGQLLGRTDHFADWTNFINSGWQPIFFHGIAILICVLIVSRGVASGIEKVSRLLIPALLLLIIISAIRAITLPGALEGIKFLFTPKISELANAEVWIQALTQNAWDTGAGWGLILTYAIYMRREEDVPLNAALIGFGNNSVSLLVGITIFCAVFSLAPSDPTMLLRTAGPANTGLTFVWFPQLFSEMPGGTFFCIIFFLFLTFAALSSLIAMVELATRLLIDLKFSRQSALRLVLGSTFIFGIPSALSVDIFINQDWVWGMGLIISGLFVALAVNSVGPSKFRTTWINRSSDIHLGSWYDLIVRYLIPLEALILIVWWFAQNIKQNPVNWLNPFSAGSVGTCLAQWGLAIACLFCLNNFIVKRTEHS